MEKLFFFFQREYESITHKPALPFRMVLESIGYIGPHWHPDMEVLLLLKGSVTISVNRGSFTMEPGDLFLVNPNEMHSFVENSENLVLVLQLDPALLSSDTEVSGYLLPSTPGAGKEIDTKLKRDMARLFMEIHGEKEGSHSFCRSHLHHFLGLLQRHIPKTPPIKKGSSDYLKQKRIKGILEYLHNHYQRRITLNEIAEKLHISPFYLSHIIKKETGYSFQENLTMIRTGKAVNLLMTTDKKLLDISMETGFSDPKYLNSGFMKLFGRTPRQMTRQPEWQKAILKHFDNDGLPPDVGRKLLESYL